MDTKEKIRVLADSAKYDVSCSSSGNSRQGKSGSLGNAVQGGICHSFTSDGRCISLLKILMTNYCIYDCAYCQNRISNDIERAFFKPEELIDLTMSFYRRNYIEGLFLSSGVVKSPDHTMELMVQILKTLRIREKFNGYIHVKGIPGASPYLIAEAGKYADRLSVNIELPEESDYASLTPQKNRQLILKPMAQISRKIKENTEEKRIFRYSEDFVPAGQSTQLIVGATPATDGKILSLSGSLYKSYGLKRVYYSAYIPVGTSSLLPKIPAPPLQREHRLYQADWLLRFYKFQTEELVSPDENLDVNVDPKTQWALRNMQLFPVEVNRASFDMLLRIPGVGLISAERMAKARRLSPLTWDGLKRMGIVLKRARHFILVSGKYYGSFSQDPDLIYSALSERKDEIQTDLFDKIDALEPAIRIKSHVPKLIPEPIPLPGIKAALPGGAS
ncbi:putative DNA modification/repair radical SAM protein [Youngiibacter multivorans]|uniref:DNA modification/repair radical SAM protein n=1 Tax=Youngiibacter multivorans TaxID=937251 RepID=A0ABS4G2J9_9CLOT|nr:putative DNA modification/repair radical SAM protein [Youngiibacter multivorans]MBP1918768.1 putative DNA modification/repair radical SAM protein [Youngiibacter multivorans]